MAQAYNHSAWRNYLRVRGEYFCPTLIKQQSSELPPRARRILRELEHLYQHSGTTSACAENTYELPSGFSAQWNYLRVRGEYVSCTISRANS